MVIKFLKLSRTPLWVPLIAGVVAIIAAALHPSFAKVAFGQFLSETLGDGMIEYLVYAIGFFALFWVALHFVLKRRHLSRQRWPKASQVSRELLFSISAQCVFIGIGAWTAFGEKALLANMYTDIGRFGWAYLIFTTFLLFVIDDTYFYWTHRTLHHPKLFEHFHRVHHESVNPTPFTAYSFHPLESVVLGLGSLVIIPIFIILPWHPASIAVFGVGSILFNVIGHLGYELYPSFWNRIPLLRWKTPAMHHYLHHQMIGGNYGLYFRWWDKLCGTEFKDFEARYDRLFASKPTLPATPPALSGFST
jgi:sterol desaturase/sphingolipid hydroxylase (fatty acid hydroxylase superfamily)